MLRDLFTVEYELATRLQLVNPHSYFQSVRYLAGCIGLPLCVHTLPINYSYIKIEHGSSFQSFLGAVGWKSLKAEAFLESARNAICQQGNVTQNQDSHGWRESYCQSVSGTIGCSPLRHKARHVLFTGDSFFC